MMKQAEYAQRQKKAPQQRVFKHMLDRDTYFVFGKIEPAQNMNADAVAMIAFSDKFRAMEIVDVNHLARPDSFYGFNLPEGDYRLVAVSDFNRNGEFDQTETLACRDISLNADAVADKVLAGIDIDAHAHCKNPVGAFRLAASSAPSRTESLFYPKGSLRALDDPIFSPDMADLGAYEPAAFLEAAPMMFYALEEERGYKVPVVFVHGIGGSVRDFQAIVAKLDRRRYKPWFFYYPSGANLKQLGAMFYKLFLSGKVIPLDEMPMVIVAHSMGGLVAREAMNLVQGIKGENRVQRLITVASPLGGHPGAGSAQGAPVVIPSWRDLNPGSAFFAGLHRKTLPAGTDYHLMFAYGDDRTVKLGENSDGVVPLASQLDPLAQKEAKAQHGFNETHMSVLTSDKALREILSIIEEVRAPFPEPFMRELEKGGYAVKLGPNYSPMETYFIQNLGFFMDAMASGVLTPIHPSQEHFVRASHGEVSPSNEIETAWLKFDRDFPDRHELGSPPDAGATASH